MADKTPKEKNQTEPVLKDEKFFEWIEALFEGPQQFPERFETRVVSGPQCERLGPMIEQTVFTPDGKKAADSSHEGGSNAELGKPSREKMVAMSNRLLSLCQRDCDQQGKTVVYGVHAANYTRESGFYARYIFRLTPQGVHAIKRKGADDDDEDDDSGSPQYKYYKQKLGHDERMFNLFGAAMEGLIDRQDRALERSQTREERLQDRVDHMAEIIEKLQGAHQEREMAAEWGKLKIRAAEKGLNFAMDMAPPLIGQLLGKQSAVAIEPTPESITIKNFLKLETEGGSLTGDQAVQAFGEYDDSSSKVPIRAGVLRYEQSMLLLQVAQCQVHADQIDQLLPGGPLEVGNEQLAALQKIFTPEQIMPLAMLLQQRISRRQQPQQ